MENTENIPEDQLLDQPQEVIAEHKPATPPTPEELAIEADEAAAEAEMVIQQLMDEAPEQRLIDINIDDKARTDFLDYAMSVIVSRALPDIRDGLKPVHRRVLHATNELGAKAGSAYKKCARIVGDTIGKYHPHGDTAVYDTLVRLAQTFSMNIPLIDGQGNFGSVDGDSPAAMRYTEARMSRLGESFMDNISEEVVDMRPNYDGSEYEPKVLPVSFPNLVVNGTMGIAVGMACNFLPHNFNEVMSAFVAWLDATDPAKGDEVVTGESDLLDLILTIMPGPDFPTGAECYGLSGYREAMATGQGRVRIRSVWHLEPRGKSGAQNLVVTAIPFLKLKLELITKLDEANKDGKIDDMLAIRDESDKEGMRIVIEMKKGADPEVLFSQMVKNVRDFEPPVSYNMTAIHNGRPVVVGILPLFTEFFLFRQEIVTRYTQYRKAQTEKKLHIFQGYAKAIDMLDATIATIKKHGSQKDAALALQELLSVDETQAAAIMKLSLGRLASEELRGMIEERDALHNYVLDCEAILASPAKVRAIIREQSIALNEKFKVPRRTTLTQRVSGNSSSDESIIKDEPCLIHLTDRGYIKRMDSKLMETQGRKGKGRAGIAMDEGDFVKAVLSARTRDYLLAWTADGQVRARRVFNIAEGGSSSRGRFVRNLFDDIGEEPIVAMNFVPALTNEQEDTFIVSVSRQGKVKRSALDDYANATRKGGCRGLRIEEGDALLDVVTCKTYDHIMLISSSGNAVRFEVNDDQLRVMGRVSAGVRGQSLDDGEEVVSVVVIPSNGKPMSYVPVMRPKQQEDGSVQEEEVMVPDLTEMNTGWSILSVGEKGVGKRTSASEFLVKGRGGKGVTCLKTNKKTGDIAFALLVREENDVILTAADNSVRLKVAGIAELGRATAGVILMDVNGSKVIDARAVPALPEVVADTQEDDGVVDEALPAETAPAVEAEVAMVAPEAETVAPVETSTASE